jgi:hypothetical protein
MACATLPAVDPTRQSDPEAAVYRMLRDVLVDLTMAERALAILEAAASDPERAMHLVAVRAANGAARPVHPARSLGLNGAADEHAPAPRV